jgi:predicted metal-dependent enzyme (double-stranded beta helix superfamily)
MKDTLFQEELQRVCRNWAAAVKSIGGRDGRIAFFEAELPALLARLELFKDILKGILGGSPYPDLRQETLFGNEFVLYWDPGRMFSLRLYIFGPGEHTFVHDHTSWGIYGSALGMLEVVRYRREDDGTDPEKAQLSLSRRLVLGPGEIDTTLPLDQGIHRTGNPGDGTTLMVSVYGTPLRRLYLLRFDLENGRLQRVFPPRIKKKILVTRALAEIESSP